MGQTTVNVTINMNNYMNMLSSSYQIMDHGWLFLLGRIDFTAGYYLVDPMYAEHELNIIIPQYYQPLNGKLLTSHL